MKGVMIQGTASDVGKSLIVTALCRLFSDEGLKVAPFKSQNMSDNLFDGGWFGNWSCPRDSSRSSPNGSNGLDESDFVKAPIRPGFRGSFIRKTVESLSGRGYRESFYEKGLEVIGKAIEQLEKEYELLVLEGAGSPVEMNLKDRELVNMKVAEMADVPVILAADIDRGGVFASLVGTLELMTMEERRRVKGITINKFRGDSSFLKMG